MSGDTHQEHKAHAPTSIGCMVITCSDTRTPETDASGQLIRKLLEGQSHAAGSLAPNLRFASSVTRTHHRRIPKTALDFHPSVSVEAGAPWASTAARNVATTSSPVTGWCAVRESR